MRIPTLVGLALVASFAVPAASQAQIASRVKRDRDRYERNDRYERYDRYDRYDHSRAGKARGGPAFCRSGRGHPVKGRRWCVDKGFGLGPTARRDYRYDRVRWDDVYFYDRYRDPRYSRDDRYRYDPRYDDRYDDRYRTGGWLERVIGDAVYGRLTNQSRSLGWNEPLRGEWYEDRDGRVLNVFSGLELLAALTDRNDDGRVDEVLMVRR